MNSVVRRDLLALARAKIRPDRKSSEAPTPHPRSPWW